MSLETFNKTEEEMSNSSFWISAALIHLGFFALIGFVVWYTQSAMPLWTLLLMPTFKSKK